MRYDKTNYNRLYAGELEDWNTEDISAENMLREEMNTLYGMVDG